LVLISIFDNLKFKECASAFAVIAGGATFVKSAVGGLETHVVVVPCGCVSQTK